MDQVKIGVALGVVVAIIVWVGGAYAVEAWREYRARYRRRTAAAAGAQDLSAGGDDQHVIPPAAAA